MQEGERGEGLARSVARSADGTSACIVVCPNSEAKRRPPALGLRHDGRALKRVHPAGTSGFGCGRRRREEEFGNGEAHRRVSLPGLADKRRDAWLVLSAGRHRQRDRDRTRSSSLHAVRIRRGTSYVMQGERDGIKKMSEGARTEVKRLAKLLPSSTRSRLARSM